jgi:hypothetical protein
MGGGSGARGDIGWVGDGRGPLGAYFARRRALRQIKAAVEADLTERGLPVPSIPMSRRKILGLVILCGLLLVSFVWLVFWEHRWR